MKELVATITGRGQVTLPSEVRRHLGAKTGDKLVFVIDDQGDVHVTVPHYPTVASVRGAAGKLDKPHSWQDIRRIAHEDRAEQVQSKRL
jgi:AbrB family looped-hinge helix DNA binding protein